MEQLSDAAEYLRANLGAIVITVATFAGIVVVAYVASRIIGRATARAVRHGDDARRRTLAPIVQTLTSALVLGAGIITALDQTGFNVATILAGAGILGLAVGFGAQSLVKDCLSGFFLILDGVLAEGDIVSAGDQSGTVERVGLRLTQIRSFNGVLWYVPNGEIHVVGNMTRQWMRAVVEVGVAYEQDVARSLEVLQRVGEQWAGENPELVLEPPEAQGVMGLNGSDVGLRLVIKLDNTNKVLWGAERALRKRVKDAFDAEGVEIPFPRQVVYHRQEEGGRLRILGGGDGPRG